MAEERKRIARMAESQDEVNDNLPTIERVYTITVTDAKEVVVDPFAKKGEAIRSLEGTTPTFKRRVTNEIKKFHRSADGEVESKQLDDQSEITGYDAFGVVTPPHSLETFARIYEAGHSSHYAAINAKAANIVGLGYKFVESAKTKRKLESAEGNENKLKRLRADLNNHRLELEQAFEDMNEELTFEEILLRFWLDYEATGNGYLEIGRGLDGKIRYLGHIPSQSMRVRRKRDGFVQVSGNKAQFFANFGAGAPFQVDDPDAEGGARTVIPTVSNPIGGDRPNEVIHMMRYSPAGGNYYGVPDIVSAQHAIAGNEFAARFNLDYFENKAVPRHLITLKGANLGTSAQSDLLSFFETGLKGQNHRSLFIPLPADDGINKVEFKIEAIESGTTDSSFVNYRKGNISDVLMAHRVPITKISISENASLAIARDADKTFKEQVCAPQQRILNKKLNRITKELTDAFELALNEMTLTDEDTQSKIDERRIKTGTETPNEQRIRRGLPGLPKGDELVDNNAKDKIAQAAAEAKTERERDSARSAGATDSAGESRNPKGEGRTTP